MGQDTILVSCPLQEGFVHSVGINRHILYTQKHLGEYHSITQVEWDRVILQGDFLYMLLVLLVLLQCVGGIVVK